MRECSCEGHHVSEPSFHSLSGHTMALTNTKYILPLACLLTWMRILYFTSITTCRQEMSKKLKNCSHSISVVQCSHTLYFWVRTQRHFQRHFHKLQQYLQYVHIRVHSEPAIIWVKIMTLFLPMCRRCLVLTQIYNIPKQQLCGPGGHWWKW